MKRKELSPTSLLNTAYWRIWYSLSQIKDLHSSTIETEDKVYCPYTMNAYFTKKTIKNTMTSSDLTKDVQRLRSTFQVCQMTKKEQTRKIYGHLSPKIAESDIVSLAHDPCGSGRFICNKNTRQNALPVCAHNIISRLVWNRQIEIFKISYRTISCNKFVQEW
jgi:hypothetical protein